MVLSYGNPSGANQTGLCKTQFSGPQDKLYGTFVNLGIQQKDM